MLSSIYKLGYKNREVKRTGISLLQVSITNFSFLVALTRGFCSVPSIVSLSKIEFESEVLDIMIGPK